MRKVTALSTHSRWIEDSLLHNAPWEEVGSTSETLWQEKIKLSRSCPFERLKWLYISKIHSFRELNNKNSAFQ